jgi:protein-S-isoprenylcysteine O-methyltransferase Ste14
MIKKLELKFPPVILVFIFSILIWFTRQFVSVESTQKVYLYAAYIFFVLSVIFPVAGVYCFRKAKTTVDPRNPSKTSNLVTYGVYKISRNPMYVGFLFFLVSLSFYLKTILGFFWCILFVVYMNNFQIIPEEKELKKQFSENYEQYLKKVSRWLIFKF